MKRIVFILTWLIVWLVNCAPSEELAEWYVVFYTDDNTIHRCARDQYYEMRELIENPVSDEFTDYWYYFMWEPYNKGYHEWFNKFEPDTRMGVLEELRDKKRANQ